MPPVSAGNSEITAVIKQESSEDDWMNVLHIEADDTNQDKDTSSHVAVPDVVENNNTTNNEITAEIITASVNRLVGSNSPSLLPHESAVTVRETCNSIVPHRTEPPTTMPQTTISPMHNSLVSQRFTEDKIPCIGLISELVCIYIIE